MNPHHARLRDRLYDTFRGRPTPLLCADEYTIPGASLWSGARLWVNALRVHDLGPGDRVLLALPRTPASVMATLACWWEGLTVCPADAFDPAQLATLDAALALADADHPSVLRRARDEHPAPGPVTLRLARTPRTPEVALLLPDSGPVPFQTIADLGARAVTSIEPFELREPWDTHDGLLADDRGLWPILFAGAIVRVAYAGRPITPLARAA